MAVICACQNWDMSGPACLSGWPHEASAVSGASQKKKVWEGEENEYSANHAGDLCASQA